MKKTFRVIKDDINSRLDRWIRRNVCKIPQSLIEKNIRKGNIKVNKKRKKSSYKMQEYDQVTLHNFNFSPTQNTSGNIIYNPTKRELSSSKNFYIENNENFVVINKPAGIAVQSGTKSRRNIIDILRETKEFINASPYSVHRIDKETTGILLVAKNRKYAQLFTSLFRMRKIHKTYLGIAIGELESNKGTFEDILFYYEGKKKIETKAITHFQVIDSNSNCSLLKLTPETGRKHQLRKQLLIHGHPIFGDLKYRISDVRKKKDNNLMLHAYKIKFSIAGTKYNFIAEPPVDFINTLKEKYLKIF